MRFVDEWRDPEAARGLARRIAERVTRPWRIMEVCGGQTHALVRFGIDRLLPEAVTLLHGPGCPVCVTPTATLDAALAIARRPEVVLCTYGDMLRVPGTERTLADAKTAGADVRIVYSTLDALALAESLPDREVVFLAVGFETTAPGVAIAVAQAEIRKIVNFSAIVAHVRVPPALEAILAGPERVVDGFLAAGHVCAVMGTAEYAPIAARHRVPIVVTGFEPLDLLDGILACVTQLEEGRHEVENRYARAVRDEGNRAAREAVLRVFEPVDRTWRGLGDIPHSGLALRAAYRRFDALERFAPQVGASRDAPECIAGAVLVGKARPTDCPAFGKACTPDHPLGATMVSSEGACAAYHRYRSVG
ncbi:MAG: hydrogenase formation protein HypD [Alphaproteobacteria bacterium]|nr:hydrogenase formation protein HypD [Alphaproteobacteria bacterium]